MDPSLQLTVAGTIEGASSAGELVTDFLNQQKVPQDTTYAAVLAVEELLTNTVRYGYDDKNHHEIALTITVTGDVVVVHLEDDGHEFDPLAAPPPDLDRPIDERPIGGLGIHLVRRMSSRLEYVRENGKNIMTVEFKRSSPAASTEGGH